MGATCRTYIDGGLSITLSMKETDGYRRKHTVPEAENMLRIEILCSVFESRL